MKSYKGHQCETMRFKVALNWLRICKGMAHKVVVSYQNSHFKNSAIKSTERARQTENKREERGQLSPLSDWSDASVVLLKDKHFMYQ